MIGTKEKLLLNDSIKVLYRYDHQTKDYDYIGENIKSLTGYYPEEIKKLGFSKIVQDKIIDRLNRFDINVNGKKETVEDFYARYLIKAKDGSGRWIEDNSLVTLSKKGERLKSIGVLRDLSLIEEYITELDDERNKINRIFDIAEVILLMLDDKQTVLMINNKGAEILGYNKDQIIGKNWFDNYLPDYSKEESRELFVKLTAGEINELPKDFAGSILGKNNSQIIIRWSNSIIKDDNGNFLYSLSSGLDITESVQNEKIQHAIHKILENANSEINLDELYKFIHQSVRELMPADNFYIALYDKEENMISFPYFVDEFDKFAPPQKFGKGLTEYVISTGEATLVDKELDEKLSKQGVTELVGTQSSVWLGVPLKILENTIGAMVVQDYKSEKTYTETEKETLQVISYSVSRAIERKRVQQEKDDLLEKLKELNQSKDKLFSLISHDLRSPFNSLLGFSEILTSEYDTLTDEEIKEYLNVIYEASKNLFGMTNNLLQYSRFQIGSFEFSPEKINLQKNVSNCLKLLKGNAVKKDIKLMSDIEKDIYVFVDEDMLNSIIQNIISNAIKFTKKGGEVKISTNIISFFDQPSQVELKVEDFGVGMSKNDMEKVLSNQMFSTPGTHREYGTGLGLLLVKEFVEKNEGSFKIESKLNVGTTVIIRFPIVN